MARIALITGITGQDGSYLAELLLEKGYEVHGLKRRSSSFNTGRIDHLPIDPHRGGRFHLHHGDMTDGPALLRTLAEVRPDEIYNLAAQSHVRVSFEIPEYSAQSGGLGALRLLEAMRMLGLGGTSRFYQASTSELFGNAAAGDRQSETTPFHPRSPYGVAKLFAHWTTVNYREAHGVFASNGILFNHESPRRGETFVSRKITRAVAAIELGLQEVLWLGKLAARRDWGHARDYVEGMWRILQHDRPEDFVLATGETRTVRAFCEAGFAELGKRIEWRGTGLDERGYLAGTDRLLVAVDPTYFRPAEVDVLCGDAAKARRLLGWAPRTGFAEMVAEMVAADLRLLKTEALARRAYGVTA